ncbi:hypothetical protein [Streptomyces chryseus]
MGKPDTGRLDRAIAQASRRLAAVQNRELWPLDGCERRAVLAGLAGGSYKVVRGESPARADRKLLAGPTRDADQAPDLVLLCRGGGI